MAAASLAQIRADFNETGQLYTLKFKQWMALVEGVITIDYISNLHTSHNILLNFESSSESSYSYQMTPPFQIQQKDKTNPTQYMLKAKDLSTNKLELLAIVFKTKSIADKFYHLITKGGPSLPSTIKHHNRNKSEPIIYKRLSIVTSVTDNTDYEDVFESEQETNDIIITPISKSNEFQLSYMDDNYQWQCNCCRVLNEQYKMSCTVCRSSNPFNWICNYCRFHNCAFRKCCMVCNVDKDIKYTTYNSHNIKHIHNDNDTDFRCFMQQYICNDNEILFDKNEIQIDNGYRINNEDFKQSDLEYTEQEYYKWMNDMKWIISIIIREHGLKARKKLYKLEIITKNLMKMEPKFRRFPQSKRTHSLLNGIKQFIEWIGYQTFKNIRHHSQKFILLNTPPRWQLIKTAKLLQLYRDKLTLPCRIPKQYNKNINNNNEEDCKEWIEEFEYLCNDNKILELMIDQTIIYETHPYNKMFHPINNIENDIKCDIDNDIEQNDNDINLLMGKHKAMSIKTMISFIGIFVNGIIVLNKLLLKYKQYNEIHINKHILIYKCVKNEQPMNIEQTKQMYKAIQEYIIDIIKNWIDQYWQYHFIHLIDNKYKP
eukprot:283849_1